MSPTVNIPRSKFNMDCEIKSSGMVGRLYPFYCLETVPGDTFQIKTNTVVRFTPMVTSPMSNLHLDTYYFFVPNRILFDDWQHFFGQDDTSAWVTPPTYKVPTISPPAGGWSEGTIADHFGIPTKVNTGPINALPFRAFAKIYSEFFRDENLMDSINCPTDGVNRTGSNGDNYVTDMHLGGKVPFACKVHDYFTSVLPKPQKSGSPASVTFGQIPVMPVSTPVLPTDSGLPGMTFNMHNAGSSYYQTSGKAFFPVGYDPTGVINAGETKNMATHEVGYVSSGISNTLDIYPNNLVADTSQFGISIPELRTAFQLQRFLETEARAGTRMTEIIKAFYHVSVPDYRIQRPEYIGGCRMEINCSDVLSQAPATADTPQGNVTGYSLTTNSHGDGIFSCSEHGFIIGVYCCRYEHVYQNSLPKMWTRGQDRTDYYLPVFAHISETPVLKKELYVSGDPDVDNQVFGYQEAWADYRYKPSYVTGAMRSNANLTLDSWHFADKYASSPQLSDTWIMEDPSNIDRCLAVTGANAGFQYYIDILVENTATRPMPLYSVPGLIDHN